MKFGTRIIHTGHTIDPTTGAVSIPIYQTSTFRQESVDHFGKYDYARSDNPTRGPGGDHRPAGGGNPRVRLRLGDGGHLLGAASLLAGGSPGGLR